MHAWITTHGVFQLLGGVVATHDNTQTDTCGDIDMQEITINVYAW